MILGLSRAIGETAPIITIGALSFIAFLPPSPVTGEFPFLSFEWLRERVHGDADPDVQLGVAPGPGIPGQRRRGRRHPARP